MARLGQATDLKSECLGLHAMRNAEVSMLMHYSTPHPAGYFAIICISLGRTHPLSLQEKGSPSLLHVLARKGQAGHQLHAASPTADSFHDDSGVMLAQWLPNFCRYP